MGKLLRWTLVVVAGLAGTMPAPAEAQQQKLVVQTDFAPHGMHAELHMAKHKGMFSEAGLDVEVLDGKGSAATIQQVAAGQIDVGFAQLGTMAAAVSNGLPVISVMGIVRAGDNGLMVPANSGWKTLKDMKGKKIAVPAGSGTAAFLDAFLKAGGITRDDLTIVNVDGSAMVSTYTSGGADAALSTVAFFLPIVAEARPSSALLFNDVGLTVPSYGFIVRRDTLQSKGDMIRKFVGVNQKAWRYILAGHEQEAVDDMLAERSSMRLDGKVLLGQLKAYEAFLYTPNTKGKPFGWQSDKDWDVSIKAMEEVAMVKPGSKPDAYFTNSFVPGN